MLKGSGRSIEGIHIRDLIEAIDTARPGVVSKFGGHAMAAGLTLKESGFADFKAACVELSERALAALGPVDEVLTDGPLAAAEMTLELARLLRVAAPWGKDFPEPLFEGTFTVQERRVVGETHAKLKLAAAGALRDFDAIAFGEADNPALVRGSDVQIAYRLEVNTWAQRDNLQLRVEHILS